MIHLGQRPPKPLDHSAPLVRKPWRGIVEQELYLHKTTYHELISKGRMPNVVAARWSIWQRISEEKHASALSMAREFGAHHTTILNALGKLSGGKRARR